jgi:sulfate adenylyltransferase subunit 1
VEREYAHGWPLCADPYASNRTTGAFVVIDEVSSNTVGTGMIL